MIHAATDATPQLCRTHPLLVLDTIVEGTRNTLDFAVAAGARRFLLTSSGAVYGAQPPEITHVPETLHAGPDPAKARRGPTEKGNVWRSCSVRPINRGTGWIA